jgi:hypothetical protein
MLASAPGRLALVAAVGLVLAPTADARTDYQGTVEVVPATTGDAADTARGVVFHDLSRDGVRQADEPGVEGVLVSNGRDVVRTDEDGAYALPVFDDMTVMVQEPAGFDVPVNADGVPQFFYIHKPDGTPEDLRYGGLPPTGPLPAAINFPLVRTATAARFSCVAMGDTQPYSNTEVGYVRDTIPRNLLAHDLADARCLLLLGDVMGDDLGLLPRFMEMMSVVGLPQYYVHGNHDYDFDASSDAHSADSWRRLYGPNYYAFEIGEVVFVALDNVVYPCGEDDAGPGREECTDPAEAATYNGRVTDRQMTWLANTLAEVPADKLVVLMHHIPFVSFVDSATGRHQTDDLAAIHELVRGRPALSLSGHTHTFEYLAAGEWYAGWEEMVGVTRLPFDHVVAGAPSGNWYQGDFGFDGTPLAFARGGTPPGYAMIHFDGADFRIDFHAANQPVERAMALSFNTPTFRDWLTELLTWQDEVGLGADAVPPVTVNDLPDQKLFTPAELAAGVFLTANVWSGNRRTEVTATIGDGAAMAMTRTQEGDGEGVRSGAAYADPFATPRQLTIGRYAWRSTSTDPRAQGVELWQGERFGPVPPQAMSAGHVADSSPHLWRLRLPEDLPLGTHVAEVTATDGHGRTAVDHVVFEVRAERPPRRWRRELWPEDE